MMKNIDSLLCCLQQCRDGASLLDVHLQPKASRDAICGLHGDALKVAIQAPPVEGKANAYLTQYLARMFGVARRDVEIHSGHTSRKKRVKIKGKSFSELVSMLESLI